MKYLDVRWLHSDPRDPVRLVSELDAENRELRKLEVYGDGRVHFASKQRASGSTRLSEEPLPSLAEISGQAEFEGKEIDAELFESLWREHVPHAT
jgi:hypothetical protein